MAASETSFTNGGANKENVGTMKPAIKPVGWCTPGELQKLSRLASQFILNRVAPDGRTRIRRHPLIPILPGLPVSKHR